MLTRAPGQLRQLLTLSAAFFLLPGIALAQQAPDLPLPRTSMGTVGLIEMPSARMADDGTLSVGASYMKDTQHYNLGFTILPWLESSFRYSGLSHFNSDYPVYWDRSFAVKVRLLEEGDVRPALAVGLNDVIGTGIYSGEYLVASKQFGDFDTSLGIGWGRLGSVDTFRNPLGEIISSLRNERPGTSTPGGTPFNSFFHGPDAGLFGGVLWHTPLAGLSVMAEYSSDSYKFEDQQGGLHPRNQMNYGMSYQLSDNIQFNLSYVYGASINGGLNFTFDPGRSQFPSRMGEPIPAPVIRSGEAQEAALRNMVGQRDPGYTTSRARTANRNTFVDELLSLPGMSDVLVSGHMLKVTLTSTGNPQTLCHAAANAAAASGTGLSEVAVRASNGIVMARCAVPRQLQEPAHFADFTRTGAFALDDLKQPMVIDATSVQPPADRRAAERKFRADVRKQQLDLLSVTFTDSEAIVYYENYHYSQEADAVERLTRLLMADAPTSIEKFRLVSSRSGIPQREFQLLRAPLERTLSDDNGDASVFDSPVTIQSAALENPLLDSQARKHYPRFDWDVFPQFRQQFFDPSNPVGVQVVGVLEAGIELAPGLSVWGQGEASIFDTFNTKRVSDSLLPHVRTDFVRYFSDGKNGVGALQANYRMRLTPEFYATIKAGYLESMFAGAGGEVLYRPDGARWALGADFYEVKQRDFDRLFGLMPYHVATGHVTLYWDSPFWDLNFQVRAGQYLAGDRGATFQVTRRFSTGVEIGAFFTKTNVTPTQFGEGSFDKGLIIRIPLDWVAPINSQSTIALDLRPVQRDGGQPLQGDATLYEETRRTSESELVRDGKSFADIQ